MTNANCATFEMNAETGLNIKDALARIVNQGKVSRGDLAIDLGVDIDAVDAILDRTEWHDLTPWLAVHDRLVGVLQRHRVLQEGRAEDDETSSLNAPAKPAPIRLPERAKRSRRMTRAASWSFLHGQKVR
jgi:hypothetical protein